MAISNGKFACRTKLDSRFRRAYPKGSPQHDTLCGLSDDEKKEFRISWAKKEYAKLDVGKFQSKSFAQVDTTLGSFHTFGGVVSKYGGWSWPPAVAAAKKTCAKLLKMQGKWVRYDPFSELTMFLIIDTTYSDIFESKWSEYVKNAAATTDVVSGEATSSSTAVDAQTEVVAASPIKESAKAKASPKSKAKQAADKGDGHDDREVGDEARHKINVSLKAANKIKPLFQRYTNEGKSLLAEIENNANYKWANNENKTELVDLLRKIEGRICSVMREYLITDIPGRRQTGAPQDICAR